MVTTDRYDNVRTIGADLERCNHVEADYRLVKLILLAISRAGYSSVVVRSGNTDVKAIITGHINKDVRILP